MPRRRRSAWAHAAALFLTAAAVACGSDRQPTRGAGDTASAGSSTTAAGGSSASTPAAADMARLLADSAGADSAAFAALPPSLEAVLDVRRVFDAPFAADTSLAWCQPMGPAEAPEIRRRMRVRLGDTLAVLFVRADRATGALRRVELVRRSLTGGAQVGFTWDGSEDRTTEVTWVADHPSATEAASIPRGSPAHRAIQALGRQLLASPCRGARRP